MVRPTAVAWMAISTCICTSGCGSLLGDVDVGPTPERQQAAGQPQDEPERPRPAPLPLPMAPAPGPPSMPAAVPDAGLGETPVSGELPVSVVDAGPPVQPPVAEARGVVVDGPVTALERVGVDGGGPRLGVCEQGIVIGVRPTANPGEDVFGQRLTFLEPICGSARADAEGGVLSVTRDDARLRWDESGDFEGAPSSEVPDERLIWVPQPETFCPESAPALVGVSGEYDPVAPDSSATSAFRSLVLECAPLLFADNGVDVAADAAGHQLLSRADSFAANGTDSYRSACEGGTVITQFLLHAGFWLDGFELGCSGLRSPRAAGAPCSADRECPSACGADGTCAP